MVYTYFCSLGPCGPVCNGPVAQLVSAPPCHGGGRGFKSRQGRGYEYPFFIGGVFVSQGYGISPMPCPTWLCSSVGRAHD